MAGLKRRQKSVPATDAQPDSTRWGTVLAGRGLSASASAALLSLCQTYWYPLYAWIRRRGHAEDEAVELAQAYFARLLEWRDGQAAHSDTARFRSFLLTSISAFLRDEWARRRPARKAPGASAFFDAAEAERRYSLEPNDGASADKLLERRWALATLEAALARLRVEFTEARKGQQFQLLHPFLTQDVPGGAYERLAKQLSLPPGTVRVTLFQLRKRYRELVRLEVSHALANPADVEHEVRALMSALA